MRVRGKFTALAIGALVAGAGTPSTALAEPGLTVDPQSPAGVEYAIPLDTARGGGGGGGSGHAGGFGSGSGGGPSRLFGAGITPPGNRSTSSTSGSGRSGSGSGTARSKRRGTGSNGGKSSSTSAHGAGVGTTVAPVTASANYSSTAPLAGVIGGVLLAGGGLGVAARLRANRSAKSR
jgi:hypothetical protein